MWFLPLETTFIHKTLNLFKILNIEISRRTIIKSQTIFNAKRARNLCVMFQTNKQTNKMEWIFYIEV